MSAENVKIRAIWESVSLAKKACWVPEKLPDPVIAFLIEGNIRLTVHDTDAYTVNPCEMFLLPDATPCKIEALEQSRLMICTLSVEFLLSDKKLLEEITFENTGQPELLKKLPVSETILQFLLLLYKCMRDGLGSYYFFDLKRCELNLLLYAYYEESELAHFFRDVLSKDNQFRRFVLNNYLTVKNVQKLAELANYSTSGFIKKFQKVFNESPYQWMQKQKAAKILIEINRGIKSLQEIANDYKFSSYQHFAGFCKAMFGFPPTEIYRKSLEMKT
ncbi:transcriptional regulator [Bacteroidia bacterium]|nr:transcriptional regulator [Bacteroidia bacterium]GHT61917.1 transcriptional regulator [Bacteroidia bacterium]